MESTALRGWSWSRTFAIAATALAASGRPAPAQLREPRELPPDAPPFQVYWWVHSPAGTDWAPSIDQRGLPVLRIEMLFEFGLYPLPGPHIAAMDPTFMARHLAAVRADVARLVPEDYDGYMVVDWENWGPLWRNTNNVPSTLPYDAIDSDYMDDWRDYIRAHHPEQIRGLSADQQEQVFAVTFEQQVKDILLPSIQACREVRPRAKWAFFWFPIVGYWGDCHLPGGPDALRAGDDTLGWLWDSVDALFPCIYQGYVTDPTLPPRDPIYRYVETEATGRNTVDENDLYLRTNIGETLRIAHGKPVYPYVWPRYGPVHNDYTQRPLNDTNLSQAIDIPREMGCNGVVIWDWINSQQEARIFQDYYDRKLGPHLLAAISNQPLNNVNFRLDTAARRQDGSLALIRAESPADQPMFDPSPRTRLAAEAPSDPNAPALRPTPVQGTATPPTPSGGAVSVAASPSGAATSPALSDAVRQAQAVGRQPSLFLMRRPPPSDPAAKPAPDSANPTTSFAAGAAPDPAKLRRSPPVVVPESDIESGSHAKSRGGAIAIPIIRVGLPPWAQFAEVPDGHGS